MIGEKFIYLCFSNTDDESYRQCRRSSDPLESFIEVPLSLHFHRLSQTCDADSKWNFIDKPVSTLSDRRSSDLGVGQFLTDFTN